MFLFIKKKKDSGERIYPLNFSKQLWERGKENKDEMSVLINLLNSFNNYNYSIN